MICPICESDYDFVDVTDYSTYEAILEFKCRGKCGKTFIGIYIFDKFVDDEGNEIECD